MEALSLTLRSVAASKARQMERQRARFEEGKLTLQHVLDCEPKGSKRLEAISAAYRDLPMMARVDNSTVTFLKNLEHFIAQAAQDPSARFAEWERRLMSLLDAQTLRYNHSILYTNIMKEWMNNIDEPELPDDTGVVGNQDLAASKKAYRAKWESYVFNAVRTDKTAIATWLEGLFTSTTSTAKAFDVLKRDIANFEKTMSANKEHFNQATMNWCVEGLLRSDLLTDDKRAVLTAMKQDRDALDDITDALNMQMNTLDRWAWPNEGVPAEQRRQVGSRYRIFHDEDLMDALLLRYIGVKWSVQMSKSLTAFSKSTWLSSTNPISKEEHWKRESYLGYGKEHFSGVSGHRLDTYLSDYYLTQLLKSDSEVDRGYNDVEEQEEGLNIRKSATELKHSLLQLLLTEIAVAKGLNNQLTVLQSDFQSFGPSIPHSTIAAVLTFFGVSQSWIQFFRKALEVPIIFKEDGTKAKIRFRRRGTPMSSPLADVFGELILFCMDYSVWHISGSRLYRLHDDFWLWGSEDSCAHAWKAMNDFAKLMGLQFNAEKTGCARVSKDIFTDLYPHRKALLPQGDVRYGFLKLSSNTGYFILDRALLDKHIDGLISQLALSKSLFAWIKTWNVHAVGYFTSMLGGNQLANCFGAQHVVQMQSVFAHVYERVFQGRGITSHLRKQIRQRFPSFTDDVLDAFIFLPIELGGLGVRNPFINLGQLRKISKDPETVMTAFLKAEVAAYATAQKASRQPFQEYIQRREYASKELLEAYETLLKRPEPNKVHISNEVKEMLGGKEAVKSYSSYDLWLLEIYKEDLIQKFGGLRIVESKLLPIGMVKLARKQRIKWKV
ncbi:MAG: hypothetical protein Q9225_003100 [Loekoesia sp. 1 TL-2023]